MQTALDAQLGVRVRSSSMPWAKPVNNQELFLCASLKHYFAPAWGYVFKPYLLTLYLYILKFQAHSSKCSSQPKCLSMYQLKILTPNNRFLRSPCLGRYLGSVMTYSKFVLRGTYVGHPKS